MVQSCGDGAVVGRRWENPILGCRQRVGRSQRDQSNVIDVIGFEAREKMASVANERSANGRSAALFVERKDL